MRKSILAAVFGGVLASGFLVLSAPVANAGPCANDGSLSGPGWGTQACADCIHAEAAAGVIDTAPICAGGHLNPGAVACEQAGRCG
jgi:hypothetical protein